MSLYLNVPLPKCLLSFISSYCFRKCEISLSVSSESGDVLFPSWDIFWEMSSFVNLILRDRFGGRCHNPLWCKDRPICNSRFPESGSLSSRLIPFPNFLVDINCLLNCYLVEKIINSLYYFLLSLFEFSNRNRYSCFILFLNLLIPSLLVCFHFFLMVFLF